MTSSWFSAAKRVWLSAGAGWFGVAMLASATAVAQQVEILPPPAPSRPALELNDSPEATDALELDGLPEGPTALPEGPSVLELNDARGDLDALELDALSEGSGDLDADGTPEARGTLELEDRLESAGTLELDRLPAGPGAVPADARPPLRDEEPFSGADGTADYDVLLRGPVHEAFADPLEGDAAVQLVAPIAPPEPVHEQPPEVRPTGKNIIWIPGYWSWDDQQAEFVYVSGLWRDVPPGRRWTPGYWHPVGDEYHWQPGFWVSETREEVAYLPPPPETLEVGPNVAAPSEEHFWVPGCWQYAENEYAWRAGYWSRMHSGWIWVPAHYISTPYGYVYVDGYWDYETSNRGLLYASVVFHRPVYLNPAYVYRPRYALGNAAALLANLFVRAGYGMYYYGNYYSPYYYSRGFQPWYAAFSGPGYASPLISYYRWRFARQGIDFGDRMDLWRRQYETDDWDRNPRTYSELQRRMLVPAEGAWDADQRSRDLDLVVPVNALLDQRGSDFVRLDGNQRAQYAQVAGQIRSIADLRRGDGLTGEQRPGRGGGLGTGNAPRGMQLPGEGRSTAENRRGRSDLDVLEPAFERRERPRSLRLPETGPYRTARPDTEGPRVTESLRSELRDGMNSPGRSESAGVGRGQLSRPPLESRLPQVTGERPRAAMEGRRLEPGRAFVEPNRSRSAAPLQRFRPAPEFVPSPGARPSQAIRPSREMGPLRGVNPSLGAQPLPSLRPSQGTRISPGLRPMQPNFETRAVEPFRGSNNGNAGLGRGLLRREASPGNGGRFEGGRGGNRGGLLGGGRGNRGRGRN